MVPRPVPAGFAEDGGVGSVRCVPRVRSGGAGEARGPEHRANREPVEGEGRGPEHYATRGPGDGETRGAVRRKTQRHGHGDAAAEHAATATPGRTLKASARRWPLCPPDGAGGGAAVRGRQVAPLGGAGSEHDGRGGRHDLGHTRDDEQRRHGERGRNGQ